MLSQAATNDPAMCGQLDYAIPEGQFYATPPEYVDCLAHYVDLSQRRIWEPAAGEGHIAKRIAEITGREVYATDLFDRGFCPAGVDFIEQKRMLNDDIEDIVTNPPYGDEAEPFVRHAIELTKETGGMVAMFLRNEWDCSSDDRPDLFEGHPAYAMKIVVTKRPRWFAGSKGSPRHNYAWFIWDWSNVDRFQALREQVGMSSPRHPPIRYIHPRDARPIGQHSVH